MLNRESQTTKTDCPNCGNGLSNIQGVHACTACNWTSR